MPKKPKLLIAAIFAAIRLLALIPMVRVFAVPVQINSGDPAFPFPQFLQYDHPDGPPLYNLGTHNPAGVTHAEMEKSIRDAYQIMMNRASYYENIALNGVKYIKYASKPDCSEGTGYALLGAAIMADKVTFDGLWLFTHDFAMNNVVRYRDGSRAPEYSYSTLPGWTNAAGGNSAADGDFDVAIALMIAYRQWGEFMGINDSRGNKISYKTDFLKVIKGLSDTLSFSANGNLLSGDIGFDGYIKGGDSWQELTRWAGNTQNLVYSLGISKRAESVGPTAQHIDYAAPAYFREFADWMQAEDAGAYKWNINQFRRAEASSDWLIGKLIAQNPRNIPVAGWVELSNDTTPVFSTFSDGEDFRAAWRTVLNYMWHGDPVYTWDPVGHAVLSNTRNSFQRGAGERFAKFLWDRRQSPWNDTCEKIIGEGRWWGPSMLKYHYSPQGQALTVYPLNWLHGTGAPSAVAARDTGLMAEMYRQAELEWDVEEPGDRYLTSVPQYFHGFFKLLGMTVLTGNHHAPMNIKRSANMKVYLDVDKTYAFEEDTITYTIDYRNYGSADAQGVVITNQLHKDFVFVSGTGGAAYDPASRSVKWNIGTVPGFKTSTGINPTKGTVTFKITIPDAGLKRYENKVSIVCANGSGWTSNGYPNKISSVMKRTGVDIARRALRVAHSVYRDTVNPGMTSVYTIDFENSAEAGWLNGGRPGVNFSYMHKGTAASGNNHTFMLRVFNDAHEAYIDYGNYRVSYFLFDNNYKGLGNNGWNVNNNITYPQHMASDFKLLHENITPGEDANGKWNQRLILQIADVEAPSRTDTNWMTMAAPTQFLINYSGLDNRVHRGISWPFKAVWAVTAGVYANRGWGGDWSYNSRASGNTDDDAMANWGYPITPDFTENPDPNYKGKPVTQLHRKLCTSPSPVTVDNILIEEWDGYTWRRVFGNGPVPGREVNNVVIRDTLPKGVTFLNFVGANPLGVAPRISGNVITWEIDKLLVGQKGRIQYSVRADTPSVFTNVKITSNAWASADRESPMKSAAILVVTRDSLPPPPPEQTTMYKRADKKSYIPGDTVVYTIGYRQTHGYPAVSNSPGQWEGANKPGGFDGRTISFGTGKVDMYFTPARGTNVTLTGTMSLQSYSSDSLYIFARRNAQGSVELKFDRKYIQSQNFPGIEVTVTSNGRVVDTIGVPMADSASSIDYRMVFKNDSLLMWMGDTSAVIPFFVLTGLAVQSGDAGVRYVSGGGGSSTRITGWASRADLAYDVTVRDTVPFGVRYIDGSASGQINTGTLAPRPLSGIFGGNVITWPVVSGSGDPLGANDSLTVTWRGIVDTSKTGSVVNTAYADLSGYPKDAVGAQSRARFSLVREPDEPDPPDTSGIPQGELTVMADPPGCKFAGTVKVALSVSPVAAGAVIWYTTDGREPDSASFTSQRYAGQPLEFFASATLEPTTLKAVAYAAGYEPSEVITHVYEPLKTVPVRFAMFYDTVGDGMAHGVKLVIAHELMSELDTALVRAHPELLWLRMGKDSLSWSKEALYFKGDTIVLPFANKAGVNPLAFNAKLVVKSPPLYNPLYASLPGYLAVGEYDVKDFVVPVITMAVYKPAKDSLPGVAGDTLAVTFNKLPDIYDNSVVLVPFELWGPGGYYEFKLKNMWQEGNTFYFEVLSMTGRDSVKAPPNERDSIRIKACKDSAVEVCGKGIWLNDTANVQRNLFNTAVPLRMKLPVLEYRLFVGPSPFKDTLNVIIKMAEPMPGIVEKLSPKAVIYDIMGNAVAFTGKKGRLEFKPTDDGYVLTWDGTNRLGRRVGTGTYQIIVTYERNGNKKTHRNKVFIMRKK